MTAEQQLALVARVAKALTSGTSPDETLQTVADTLRAGLATTRVSIWRREPNATTFYAVSSPSDLRAAVSLDDIEESAPTRRLVRLDHSGVAIGALEAELGASDAAFPDSLLRVIADVIAPFLDAVGLSEDLADEVASRSREIDEQRRFTSLVIDSLPVGLYVLDRDYRIQVWNRKRETGTQGLRRDEVVGRPVFDVLTRQPAEQLKAEFDRVFRTGELQQFDLDVGQGGDRRFYRLTKIPMRLEGDAITHVITIGEDVTEAHAIQQQILQSDKLAAVGQLAAGVMHEINNPLATIGVCVTAIQARLGGEVEATVKEYLAIIDHEVQRCTRIVDGLLDFSRPKELGKEKRSVDLNALVEHTLFLLKHHKRFRKVDLHREFTLDLPQIWGNEEQLIQVFMSLMLNAMDAMEHGGSLTLRTRRHTSRSDAVIAEVEDTGVGIPTADLTKIFEPFYTTKPPGRGTGLGLSICYGILEEHRGRIEVDSEPGRGSVFRMYLPVAVAAEGEKSHAGGAS